MKQSRCNYYFLFIYYLFLISIKKKKITNTQYDGQSFCGFPFLLRRRFFVLQFGEPDAEVEHGRPSRAKLTETLVSSALHFLLDWTSFCLGSLADNFIFYVLGLAKWLTYLEIGWISDGKWPRFDGGNWAIICENEGWRDDWSRWTFDFPPFWQMSVAAAAALCIALHPEHRICDITFCDKNPSPPGFHFKHFCDRNCFVLATDAAEDSFAVRGQVCHKSPLLEELLFVGFP